MNGAMVNVGRGTNSINAGRSTPALNALSGGFAPNAGSQFWPVTWPRVSPLCRPQMQCCCQGPVNIAPGDIQALMLNWGTWIESTSGFVIDSVASASLVDPANCMKPADPEVIKIVSGFRECKENGNGNGNGETLPAEGNGTNGDGETTEEPNPNADVAKLIALAPPYGTLILIEAASDARIGAQFKLDICLVAHDCDGRRIRQCDCVVFTVAQC